MTSSKAHRLLRFVALLPLCTWGCMSNELVDPVRTDDSVLVCMVADPYGMPRGVGSVASYPVYLRGDGRLLFDHAGDMSFMLGIVDPRTDAVKRLRVEPAIDMSFLRSIAQCPYDARRILLERYAAYTGDIDIACWGIDEARQRVAPIRPDGWPAPALAHEMRIATWLSGSSAGNDSIAGLAYESSEPIVYVVQKSMAITDASGPIPISNGMDGRHRITVSGDRSGHDIYLDGELLTYRPDGSVYNDATWSLDNRWLLLEVFSVSRSAETHRWLIDVTRREAPRRFTFSPACLPVGRMQFMTNTTLAAEAIEDSSSTEFLYEISLDGRALRMLTRLFARYSSHNRSGVRNRACSSSYLRTPMSLKPFSASFSLSMKVCRMSVRAPTRGFPNGS